MTLLSNWNGVSFTAPGAAKMAIWDSGTPGTLSPLTVIPRNRKKTKITLAIDDFPKIFLFTSRKQFWNLREEKKYLQ